MTIKKINAIILTLATSLSLTSCNNSGSSAGASTSVAASTKSATHTSLKVQASAPQYPKYPNAVGISNATQVNLEAAWLHQNAIRDGGVTIPKSYGSSKAYWDYMATNNNDYKLFRAGDGTAEHPSHDDSKCEVPPIGGGNNDATIERVIVNNGLDIYDGAVWQMALALVANKNSDYLSDVQTYNTFLTTGLPTGFQSYYAFQNPDTKAYYKYNGEAMKSEKYAYTFKFVTSNWGRNRDFLNDCNMSWPIYEAVTGEEAWAALIGPIQTLHNLYYDHANPNNDWTINEHAGQYIIIARDALPALKQMQDKITGGVYRNVTLPGGTQSFDISLENDFSLYAGLTMLGTTLEDQKEELLRKPLLKSANINLQSELNEDNDDIATIDSIKAGLLKFFTNNEGHAQMFNSAGYFDSSYNNGKISEDFAVDVQTWGATVIVTNPELESAITHAYGSDAPYKMFEAAISKSGYYNDAGTLLGVGYTTQKTSDAHYELSGEWTLGAINAAIVLAEHYKDDPTKKAVLIKQAQEMLAGVTQETSSLSGPTGSSQTLSYLYANKRAYIPFGWWSNKVPSTASTAWSLMVNSCYEPFELGGGKYTEICKEVGIIK